MEGEGRGVLGNIRTTPDRRGRRGLKITILAGRPLWMPPNQLTQAIIKVRYCRYKHPWTFKKIGEIAKVCTRRSRSLPKSQHSTTVIRRFWSGSPFGTQKASGSIRNLDPEEFSEDSYFDPDKIVSRNYTKKYVEMTWILQLLPGRYFINPWKKLVFRMTEVGRIIKHYFYHSFCTVFTSRITTTNSPTFPPT